MTEKIEIIPMPKEKKYTVAMSSSGVITLTPHEETPVKRMQTVLYACEVLFGGADFDA